MKRRLEGPWSKRGYRPEVRAPYALKIPVEVIRGKPVYFDLTVRDLDVARTFSSAVLGWTFDRFEGVGYPHSRIQARSEDEVGIGEIRDAPMSEGRPLTLVTIQVPDLDKLLRLVEENVGSVLEAKRAIPRIGWFATCAEPGGQLFGMVQPDPLPTLRIGDLALTATRASDEAGEKAQVASRQPDGSWLRSSTAPTSG